MNHSPNLREQQMMGKPEGGWDIEESEPQSHQRRGIILSQGKKTK